MVGLRGVDKENSPRHKVNFVYETQMFSLWQIKKKNTLWLQIQWEN